MLRQISEHIILGFGRLSFQILISVSVPNSSLIVCYGGCPCSSFLFPGGQVSGIFSTISHLLVWPLTLLGLHHSYPACWQSQPLVLLLYALMPSIGTYILIFTLIFFFCRGQCSCQLPFFYSMIPPTDPT